MPVSFTLFSALLLQLPSPAPDRGPLRATPRSTRPQPCPDEQGEDIVVCGQRYDENSSFRIPQELRNQRSDEDRHASWEARWRDEQIVGSFASQSVGPSGFMQANRERDCQWRAERQTLQGRRPDCGRRNRPDDVSDWQRR